ncbi:hypothetical protein BST61_g7531 [Cercospora zeina]
MRATSRPKPNNQTQAASPSFLWDTAVLNPDPDPDPESCAAGTPIGRRHVEPLQKTPGLIISIITHIRPTELSALPRARASTSAIPAHNDVLGLRTKVAVPSLPTSLSPATPGPWNSVDFAPRGMQETTSSNGVPSC